MSDTPDPRPDGIVPPHLRQPPRARWFAPDVIAIIIAGTLALSALIVITTAALLPDDLPAAALEAMSDIGKVLAGALAAYLGLRRYSDR